MMNINAISDMLADVEDRVVTAMQAVQNDPGSTPTMRAVMTEFYEKCLKTMNDLDEAEEEPIREHIVELEQAGDSARVAAEAEQSLKQKTRDAVLAAHDIICALKADTAE
jgi:hypothetical protein